MKQRTDSRIQPGIETRGDPKPLSKFNEDTYDAKENDPCRKQ